METKEYGKFEDTFDFYTVEETGYFGGECLGGQEYLRTMYFSDAKNEFMNQADLANLSPDQMPDFREEYDWGLCYVWVDAGGRVVVSMTGHME